MNKAEKLIQKQFLNDEEAIIRRLKTVYKQSHKDITGKISKLDMSIGELQKAYADIGDEIGPLAGAVLKRAGNLTPDQAKETIQSMIQSKVYQKQYQEALKSQIDGTLDKLLDKQYTAVSDYLNECYENAFVGTMMNLQSQGIPLIMPIDQEAMVRAVQLDSPIKEGLYKHLGEDVGLLKRRITAEVSRGISTGMTYSQVADQLARKMMGTYENPGGSLAYATRIARTEGHRIQCQSAMDACRNAKDSGADVVKQWDSTLDGRTRESHQAVDGEIRELDKKFSNGLMYPGDPTGGAAEVVNCRCALLQRAKWALDEDELETLKERAAYFGLDKTGNFEDYKKKYLKAAEGLTNSVKSDIIQSAEADVFTPAKTIKEAEAFAKTMGFECSYKGVDLKVANEMNAAFHRGVKYCPGIKDQMKFVGSAQQRNKLLKAELQEYYLQKLKKQYPGMSDSWYEKYAKQFASKSVGRVDSGTYAFASRLIRASDSGIPEKYTGIVVNNAWGGDYEKFVSGLVDDVKSKWHPVGTETIASVFDHEVAHQIDYATGLRTNPDMVSLWNSLSKTEIGDKLSRYASKNIAEFIAEGYAEYCNNPTPRDLARKIGAIIEGAVKK